MDGFGSLRYRGETTNRWSDLDIDDVWAMLRALIVERFQMTTHTEDRPVTAYNLVAVKPKMKKADPNSRTKYKEGPGRRW